MPIESLTLGVGTDVGVTLLDTGGVSVNGVTFDEVTVQFRKPGETALTLKSLLAGQ